MKVIEVIVSPKEAALSENLRLQVEVGELR